MIKYPNTIQGMIEFLHARLDEDEKMAKAADPAAFETPDDWEPVEEPGVWEVSDRGWQLRITSTSDNIISIESEHVREDAMHYIASQHPSRTLKRVHAQSAILAHWGNCDRRRYNLPPGVRDGRDPDERMRDDGEATQLDWVVKQMATEYADHPEYLAEWGTL